MFMGGCLASPFSPSLRDLRTRSEKDELSGSIAVLKRMNAGVPSWGMMKNGTVTFLTTSNCIISSGIGTASFLTPHIDFHVRGTVVKKFFNYFPATVHEEP